jgi:hypothetical protein
MKWELQHDLTHDVYINNHAHVNMKQFTFELEEET